MIKKNHIFFITAVLFVTFLGSLSYQQVAVLNVPQASEGRGAVEKTPMPTPAKQTKIFESIYKNIKFAYPEQWSLTAHTAENETGTYGKILQSSTIGNYEQSKQVSGGLPDNAIRIDIVLSTGGNSKTLDQLIDCAGKVVSCENTEINGRQFKRATHTLNTGNTLIQLATKVEDTIILVTAVVSTGEEYNKNLVQLEEIIKSIQT